MGGVIGNPMRPCVTRPIIPHIMQGSCGDEVPILQLDMMLVIAGVGASIGEKKRSCKRHSLKFVAIGSVGFLPQW